VFGWAGAVVVAGRRPVFAGAGFASSAGAVVSAGVAGFFGVRSAAANVPAETIRPAHNSAAAPHNERFITRLISLCSFRWGDPRRTPFDRLMTIAGG
jgi:hypothetical protein